MGISRRTLRIDIAVLEECGFVRREQLMTPDSGTGPNRYRLDGLAEKHKKLRSGFEADPTCMDGKRKNMSIAKRQELAGNSLPGGTRPAA